MGSSASALPTRAFNKKPNPYWGMAKKNCAPGAVFIQGQESPEGFEGGFPTWVYVEVPQLPPSDSQDVTVFLPDGFTLFGFVGQCTQMDGGGFSYQFYDESREVWLNDRLTNFQLHAGQLGNVMIERDPYTFTEDRPTLMLRIANHSYSTNDIQIALFGVRGGAKG